MRTTLFVLFMTALAGCSANGSGASSAIQPVTPALQREAPAAKAGGTVVYSCQAVESICDVFTLNGQIIGSLSSTNGLNGPQGTRADPSGNWYIANAMDHNILEFSAKGKALLGTLKDKGALPVDVAVGGNVVGVANQSGPGQTSASVSVYVNGATKPTRHLTDPAAAQGVGIAFDSHGNCFWSYALSNAQGRIDEFQGCAGAPQTLDITTGLAGGLAFDGQDNLYYIDATFGVYSCSGITMCGARFTSGFSHPLYLNFNKTRADLWISDLGTSTIREIDLATGTTVHSFGFSPSNPPFGVATGPGPKF